MVCYTTLADDLHMLLHLSTRTVISGTIHKHVSFPFRKRLRCQHGRAPAGPKRKPGRPSNAELLERFANSHRQPEPGAGATPPAQHGSSSGSGGRRGRGRERGRGRGDSNGRPPSAQLVCPFECQTLHRLERCVGHMGRQLSCQVWVLITRSGQHASSFSATVSLYLRSRWS